MASNPFDEFDPPTVAVKPRGMVPRPVAPRSRPNPFDEFDQAVAAQDEATIDYQAKAQEEYMRRQEAIRQFEVAHPEARVGSDLMREEPPPLDPYLKWRTPPIAAREETPKQKMGSGFSATFQLGLVEDQDTKKRILARTLFPNDPDGIYRVGFDAAGQPVYVGDDGKLHKIASGTARFGANMLADSPEMLGSGVGAVAGPWGAGLGGAGAHGIKRGVAGLIYDEPQTIGANLAGMATEGITATAGEAAGRGLSTVLNRNRVVDFTPEDMAAAEALRQRVKASTGIDLDLAQASGDRRLIALRAYVARYPGPSAKLIQAAEERARGQFHEATTRVLDTISNATPAEVAGQNGINAAQLAIDTARRTAEARVEPLYRAAYESAPAVMDPAVIRFFRHPEFREAYRKGADIARLEEKEAKDVIVTTTRRVHEPPGMTATEVPQMSAYPIPDSPAPRAKPPGLTADQRRIEYKPEARPPGTDLVPASPAPSNEVYVIDKNGNVVPQQRKFQRERMPSGVYRVREIVDEEVMKVPDLRALDYTKRGLDAQIEALKAAGKRQEARALAFQRRKFVKALDDLDIPEYKAAREAWKKELADNINPLEKGVIGVLSRIKDVHASKAAARMFSDPNLTPTMVEQAKAAIQKESPGEWNALSRSWIAYKFNQAQRVPMTSTDVNTPGRLHQMLFGTPTARANTIAMLDKPSADALSGVMEAAEALKRTPIAGSNTFRDQETKEIFEGLTGTAFNIWNAISSPREALRTAAQRHAVEQSTLSVAEAIIDPSMRHKLRVVLRMQPSTKRNILLFNVLGAETAKVGVETNLPEGKNSKLVAGEANAVGE